MEIISRFNIDPLFVCAKCMQPIKISKISKKKGESQFFTHCKHDVKCAWKISNDIKPLADVIINDSDFDCISKEYSRYNHLKQLIIKTLNKQKNTGDDIEIINDTKITACNNKRSWRKYDIVIRWHGKNIVFKLQRSKDFLQDLVSHDKFVKENNYYIIWIFGSDSATRYDYLLELNYQNTMFDNKSCVFILDKESEIECEKTGVLHLKCNWLVDGKQWYYTIKKSGTNGKLITLDDLIFDDNNYKPYYKEGFEPNLEDDRKKLKSDIYAYRIGSLWGLINSNQNIRTKCKYSLIELDNDGRIRATTADYPHQKVGYISDEGEEIPTCKENLNNNIFMICVFEQWYLALDTGQRLSENFDQIIKWNENRVVFKQNNKFGILDYQGEIISEAKYKSFMIESEEKAIVSDSSGTYYIDINGNIIAEETVILKDDFKKVKHLGKWGLMKDGKLIIDYIYDEIGSFRCRLYGFCDKKIIKLANDPRYNYRISFKAKYITYSSVFYVFEINGVKLFMPDNEYNHQTRVKGEYYDVQLLNIDRSIERISIMALNNKNINSKFEHIDQDSDFPKNKHFTGIITFIKSYNGRRYVKFENGQETYISKNRIARCGFNPNNYVVNSKITLEKTGFDDFYERTIWKVIR